MAEILGQPRFKRLAPEGLPWAGAYAWEKLENAARLAQAVQPVTYAEGCFGRFLLREDPAMPLLQFGYGGRPPPVPDGPGLGVSIDEAVLQRWTVERARVG